MLAHRPVSRGTTYTVWSYAPRPTPRALAASPPRYPAAAGRYLELGTRAIRRVRRAPGREATTDRIFHDQRYRPLWAYRPLWEEARRLTAKARSPYEATLVLERWFRDRGGFRYEEHPPRSDDEPPARRLRRGDARRVLPALRGRDGADAPDARRPGPGRRRLHRGDVEGRRVDRDRPPGARLGRGLVRRVRMARLRPDAGARHAVCRLHARVRLGGRRAGARDGPVPRLHADARPRREAARHPSSRLLPRSGPSRGGSWERSALRSSPWRSSWARSGHGGPRGSVETTRVGWRPACGPSSCRPWSTGARTSHRTRRRPSFGARPSGCSEYRRRSLAESLADARYGPPARAGASAARARDELRRVLAAAAERERPAPGSAPRSRCARSGPG